MRKKTRRVQGFTLVEIMIVVALIGLLAAVAIPNWVHARTTSQINNCINNLRQIDAAKQQWALETRQATNALPLFSDVSGYLKSVVVCPASGPGGTFDSSYSLNDIGTKPTCNVDVVNHVLPLDSSN